ncbi:hypothetical protein [Thomasclavelia spiroformis]|uniref:hypothetical protein n=1 Tax=Thomasclavelia spiroformis TaxID=29348 RepID=UPI00241DB9BB|nr:hypothetical protein [Thomasclavelia spiroformis]MBS6116552.1 hypothetical protein [Thomasclavelia spiroformis]
MKKKKIILISISIAIIFFLFGIHYTKINKADQTEIINIDNIKTVKQIFNTNKKYIIQFSKKNCYFCEKLEKVEEKLKFTGKISFYKYTLTDKGGLEEFSELKKLFPKLEYAPSIYYVENGKVVDELIIADWENCEMEIQTWLEKLNAI